MTRREDFGAWLVGMFLAALAVGELWGWWR